MIVFTERGKDKYLKSETMFLLHKKKKSGPFNGMVLGKI
jgi:hypothetical protein